jgi:galactonate dehydratase
MAFWPGLALSIVIYGVKMFGDAVRDILDPRLRGGAGRYGVSMRVPGPSRSSIRRRRRMNLACVLERQQPQRSKRLKITDIRISQDLGKENRHWVLLKMVTDEGIEGLGEWTLRCPQGSHERLKKGLVGRDPLDINRIHHDLLWPMQGVGAGVEIALWDIAGKKLGVPLYRLLGGKLRDRIRMYCDCHSGTFWTQEGYDERWEEVRRTGKINPVYTPEAYARAAKDVVARGFTAIKFDVDVANPWKRDVYDRSISRSEHLHIVSLIEAVRDAVGPEVDFAVDLHGSFNMVDALSICKDVEHLGLMWLEDPVRWEWGNVDALAKVCRQTSVPICTGEILYGARQHRELIVTQACDMIEPDIPRSGGVIETRRLAELAEMYHMSVSPHNMASPITAIAAAHICATIPNFLVLEYHSSNIPLWSEMLSLKDPIKEGYIEVPEGPGLGVALDEEAIAQSIGVERLQWH